MHHQKSDRTNLGFCFMFVLIFFCDCLVLLPISWKLLFERAISFISKNWIKMILRIAFLFLVSIENNQFLGNLLVFKDISIDNSMINTKVIILAINNYWCKETMLQKLWKNLSPSIGKIFTTWYFYLKCSPSILLMDN